MTDARLPKELPDLGFVRRFGRQLILPEIGYEGQRRLATSSVLVVGVGGLGSSAALGLAAAGIGTIHLLDPDEVELSNLHRQLLYVAKDVGRPKVEAAAEALRARNPSLKVEAERASFEREDAVRRAATVDLVVDASDNFPTRYRVSDACARARRPDVFAAVHRLEGQLAVFDTRHGPCYRCLFPEPPPPEFAEPCGEAGVLGPLPGMLGTLQAMAAIAVLLGWDPPAAGKLTVVDAREMGARSFRIARRSGCEGCDPKFLDGPMPAEPAAAPAGPPGAFRFVEAAALTEELRGVGGPGLVDLRNAEERRLGVLPGALWVPFDELAEHAAEIGRLPRVVLFCQWGGRSERAARWLSEAGLRDLRVLRGGFDALAPVADAGSGGR